MQQNLMHNGLALFPLCPHQRCGLTTETCITATTLPDIGETDKPNVLATYQPNKVHQRAVAGQRCESEAQTGGRPLCPSFTLVSRTLAQADILRATYFNAERSLVVVTGRRALAFFDTHAKQVRIPHESWVRFCPAPLSYSLTRDLNPRW